MIDSNFLIVLGIKSVCRTENFFSPFYFDGQLKIPVLTASSKYGEIERFVMD